MVIPARYASTRLPGKPLADIGGLPMIVRVARQALASGARNVVVATDDPRVQRAVVDHGLDAMLTRADHQSGSDRVMEVVSAKGWSDHHIVINVQGDEPLIPPVVIRQVAPLCSTRRTARRDAVRSHRRRGAVVRSERSQGGARHCRPRALLLARADPVAP